VIIFRSVLTMRNVSDKRCAGDKIEKNEIGWACGAYG